MDTNNGLMGSEDFDRWAADYDASVQRCQSDNAYPFAGYERILDAIFRRLEDAGASTVLDVGFGTGVLASRCYQHGMSVWGQDFSARMLALAQEKMPDAHLYQGDFSLDLVPPLKERAYDAITATYSLHHLDGAQKPVLLQTLLGLLNPGGRIYIGDVAFETPGALEACRARCGDEWDDSEFYFVVQELRAMLEPLGAHCAFTPFSACSGLIEIWR